MLETLVLNTVGVFCTGEISETDFESSPLRVLKQPTVEEIKVGMNTSNQLDITLERMEREALKGILEGRNRKEFGRTFWLTFISHPGQ